MQRRRPREGGRAPPRQGAREPRRPVFDELSATGHAWFLLGKKNSLGGHGLVVKRRAAPDILGTGRRPPIAHDDVEQRVRRALDGLGVPYELIPIDPEYADTAAFCERYGFPPERCGNTIIVGSKKEPRQYSACVVQATSRLDVNHTVKRLMGVSRLSFADAEGTRALTGMMIGGVTVFALPDGLPIYVDDKLVALDWVILGGGSRSSKIKIAPGVFSLIPNAAIVPGLSLGG